MAIFVVHEHHARHLHYDLRLEMDGVLKSWAVPKGPSINPRYKRLAVMVDDHSLEYADFEGTIPEGQYGAGKVVIWDKGEFSLLKGGIKEGNLEFELKGKRLKGRFALIKIKKSDKNWLLIKMKDAFAERI